MGGFDWESNKNLKSVEFYHLQTRTWSSLPDLKVARNCASSCCHGGYIYIFGGTDDEDYTNKIERMNLSYLRASFSDYPSGSA